MTRKRMPGRSHVDLGLCEEEDEEDGLDDDGGLSRSSVRWRFESRSPPLRPSTSSILPRFFLYSVSSTSSTLRCGSLTSCKDAGRGGAARMHGASVYGSKCLLDHAVQARSLETQGHGRSWETTNA